MMMKTRKIMYLVTLAIFALILAACPTGNPPTADDDDNVAICNNDGTCDSGETATNCPADCSTSCIDADSDGYGANCDLGMDCNDNDAAIHENCPTCIDADGDGHSVNDATYCPAGNDNCDDDPNNWTVDGCSSCVDVDGDNYGANCDLGPDCNDADNTIHSGCPGCVDADSDGHSAVDAIYCPAGDDNCDDNPNSFSAISCSSCVDADSDGYGVNCDKGDDCDDNDANIHTGCVHHIIITAPNSPGNWVFRSGTSPYPTLKVPVGDTTNTGIYDLRAKAYDVSNNPISGVNFQWSSGDSTIADFIVSGDYNEVENVRTKKNWFENGESLPTTTITVNVGGITASVTVEAVLSIDVTQWCWGTNGSYAGCGPVFQDGEKFTHNVAGGSSTGTITGKNIDWTNTDNGCIATLTGYFDAANHSKGNYTTTCDVGGTWDAGSQLP